MEPNLNDPFREDAQLKSLLATHSPALPDDGFSARVMAALPAPSPRSPLSPWLICGVGTVAGVAFVLANGASWSDLGNASARFTNAFAPLLASLLDPKLALALGVTGLSLLLAFAINRQYTRLH